MKMSFLRIAILTLVGLIIWPTVSIASNDEGSVELKSEAASNLGPESNLVDETTKPKRAKAIMRHKCG